jgi:TolB-like protein
MNRLYLLTFFILSFFFLFLMGCASTNYSRGHKALENDKYDLAIRELKQAIIEDFRNAEAIRDLGIAMYYRERPALASRFLALAAKRRTDDPQILYYLGASYEELGKIDKAIEMYSRYADVSPLSPMRQEIEGRLLVLLRQQMAEQLKSVIAQEQAINVEKIPDNSIAVLYFANMSGNEQLTLVQKGLADMLITDLSQVNELTVIERARLQQLMEEIGLGMSGLVDEQSAPRIGKLLGASRVVRGTLLSLGNQDLRIDAGLSDIKTGEKSDSEKLTGSLNEFYRVEKDLAFGVIDMMGIRLSADEKEAIDKIPTKNLLAFMSYCQALDYEDRGLWDQAGASYQQAIQKDPGFAMAQNGLQRANAFSAFSTAPPKPKVTDVEAKGKGGTGEKKSTGGEETKPIKEKTPVPALAGNNLPAGVEDSAARLFQTANNVSAGFVPGIESRKPTTETSTTSFGASASLKIQFKLPTKE